MARQRPRNTHHYYGRPWRALTGSPLQCISDRGRGATPQTRGITRCPPAARAVLSAALCPPAPGRVRPGLGGSRLVPLARRARPAAARCALAVWPAPALPGGCGVTPPTAARLVSGMGSRRRSHTGGAYGHNPAGWPNQPHLRRRQPPPRRQSRAQSPI